MIWAKWREPNFRFHAVDMDGHTEQHFCHAESDEELRTRLITKYHLRVQHIEPYDFSEWKVRAKLATQQAIADHEANRRPIKFKDGIWRELKWHLFELFYGKCAYCESMPRAVSAGDVEHYRPKAKVKEDPSHPGYYWLAYDVSNLLPACELCNRNPAKMIHFPIQGVYARDHRQPLDSEDPLLLNPYNRIVDPFEHLEFLENGEVIARENSSYGNTSRTIYRLNRAGIGDERCGSIGRVRRDWSALAGIYSSSTLTDARRRYWDDVLIGNREYSAAQRWELYRITERGGI